MKHSFLFFYFVGIFIQLQMCFWVRFYFYIRTNVNTKELMQFQYDKDTSATVNIHGLLEMKGDTRWTGDVSVYLWAIRTCYASDTEKCHRKSLHKIIKIGSMWYLNISRACMGHCLVILKCSCRNHSSKTCSSPLKTTSSNIRTSVPIAKICRQR